MQKSHSALQLAGFNSYSHCDRPIKAAACTQHMRLFPWQMCPVSACLCVCWLHAPCFYHKHCLNHLHLRLNLLLLFIYLFIYLFWFLQPSQLISHTRLELWFSFQPFLWPDQKIENISLMRLPGVLSSLCGCRATSKDYRKWLCPAKK